MYLFGLYRKTAKGKLSEKIIEKIFLKHLLYDNSLFFTNYQTKYALFVLVTISGKYNDYLQKTKNISIECTILKKNSKKALAFILEKNEKKLLYSQKITYFFIPGLNQSIGVQYCLKVKVFLNTKRSLIKISELLLGGTHGNYKKKIKKIMYIFIKKCIEKKRRFFSNCSLVLINVNYAKIILYVINFV